MHFNNPNRLRDERGKAVAEMRGLCEILETEKRGSFRPEEERRFQFCKKEIARCDAALAKLPTHEEQSRMKAVQWGDDGSSGTAEQNSLYRNSPKMATSFNDVYKQQRAERGTLSVLEPPSQWVDTKTGDTVEVLSATERLCSEGDERQLHFGRLIRGLVTSKWDNANREREYLAQGGNVNVAGGVLVNAELSTGFIDKVRAAMVTLRAGAKTIPMQ